MDAGQVVDAGPSDAGGLDAGFDAGTDAGLPMPALTDYRSCNLDIECPSGLGRCQKSFPLHHPDSNGHTSVAASAVFIGLDAGGVCGETCELDPNACATSTYLTNRFTFSCQLVYAAASPYHPGTASDAGAMNTGVSFAAVCRPPLGAAQNCGACATDGDCGGGTCWDLGAHAAYTGTGSLGACVMPCGANSTCPGGFTCDGSNRCLPLLPTCGACVDRDHDGFGTGFCGAPDVNGKPTVTTVDCDDTDATSSWRASLQCGPVDHDCNGFPDSVDMVGTDSSGAQHCSACNDACPSASNATINGLSWACQGAVGSRTCVRACLPGLLDCDSNPDCEVGPTTAGHQFAPDLDGDGFSCNPAPGSTTCTVTTACTAPANSAPARAYSATVASCSAGTCPDAVDGNATIFPGAPERCDGLDNNQNGTVDDGFLLNGAAVCLNDTLPVNGTCPGSTLVTIGSSCSATCGTITGAGTYVCSGHVICQPSTSTPEVACNGQDDNCNGRVDEPLGDPCDVTSQPVGTLNSSCWQNATRNCSNVCVPAAASLYAGTVDAPGDNFDADCDGSDLQKDAIYVFAGYAGATQSNGTAAAPYKDLTSALNELNVRPGSYPSKTLYLQHDTTNAKPVLLTDLAIPLTSGVRIYGGFTGATTNWAMPAVPLQTPVCMPPSSKPFSYVQAGQSRQAWIGLTCRNSINPATPAIFRNVLLEVNKTGCGGAALDVPPAVVSTNLFGASVYGAIFKDCDEITLRNVTLRTFTPPIPPADLPASSGANGAGGGVALVSTAGGKGGAGGQDGTSPPTITGSKGSSAAPSAAPDTLGGTGGGVNVSGATPTTFGSRGSNGAAPVDTLIYSAQPAPNRPSYFLSGQAQGLGLLQVTDATLMTGMAGGTGAFGFGAGGGGSGVVSPLLSLYTAGGTGGQGGGGAGGGRPGGPGGDSVGLVLLGSQLPPVCNATAPDGGMLAPDGGVLTNCGENVRVTVAPGARGGAGGSGGVGGAGGAGSAGVLNAGWGGTGGKGCGGGGASGGRGGATLGIVGDYQSLKNNQPPTWLTIDAVSASSNGGPAGAAGADGAPVGSSYSCTDAGVAAAPGRDGQAYTSVVLPMASCADARTVDTDFPPNTAQWIIVGGVTQNPTCP